MSFILDALKKSENERQRTIGPSLADAPLRRQQIDRPWWALAVGALLVVNLGVLLIVLTRGNDKPAPAATIAPAVAAPAATTAAPPPAANPPTRQAVQVSRPQRATPAASPAVRSLAEEANEGYDDYAMNDEAFDAPSHPAFAAAAGVPPGPSIVRPIEAPSVAPLPRDAAASAARAADEAGTESLPTMNALAATGAALPDLHLDIHVYSTKPAERFVFVNMRKYHEGDTLSEGPTIERITPDGTVLNHQGQRFVLPRQ